MQSIITGYPTLALARMRRSNRAAERSALTGVVPVGASAVIPREATLGVRSGLSLTHAYLGQSLDTPGDGWVGGGPRQEAHRSSCGGRAGTTELLRF